MVYWDLAQMVRIYINFVLHCMKCDSLFKAQQAAVNGRVMHKAARTRRLDGSRAAILQVPDFIH